MGKRKGGAHELLLDKKKEGNQSDCAGGRELAFEGEAVQGR